MIISQDMLQQAYSRISSGQYNAKGSICCFYRLTQEIGIKVYTKRYKAEKTHELQSICAKFGLAPKIYSRVLSYNNMCYFYFTEIAQHLRTVVPAYKWYIDPQDPTFTACTVEVADTKRALLNLGLLMDDDIPDNWGVINGKVVCIDFGYCLLKPKNSDRQERIWV